MPSNPPANELHRRAILDTDAGFVEVRDKHGKLWGEFHPERRIFRRIDRRTTPGVGASEVIAEISLDKLIAGELREAVVTFTRPKREVNNPK